MRPVVHVVGGGPGDPELLTVKGARLLGEARFVLYTGSLFPEGALRELAPKAALLDSKGMTLEEIVLALAEEARKGGGVVRLHSGDPGLYGTLLEEKEALEALCPRGPGPQKPCPQGANPCGLPLGDAPKEAIPGASGGGASRGHPGALRAQGGPTGGGGGAHGP